MTTFLRYYSRENVRHAEADQVKGDLDLAISMTRVLCRHFRVPTIKVKLFRKGSGEFKRLRKVQSWYRPGSVVSGRAPVIVYHPTMLSALTVAHEVGHYVDDTRCKQAKVRRVRWHSAQHRALVDQGVEALKTHHKFRVLFDKGTSGVMARYDAAFKNVLVHGDSTELATATAKLINEFYAKLPEKLTCPCCNAHIPKQNFGVRVMKKDAQGLPLVIRRQSYCKACR